MTANLALERTRGERPWLRNDVRCVRAAQRERWAASIEARLGVDTRSSVTITR